MIALAASASLCGACVAGAIDARTGFIPDSVTAPTALLAIGLSAAGGSALAAFAGACAAGGTLLALYLITRRRGIGFGDVKLAAAIGAGFGAVPGLAALGIAFVAGAGYAVVLLAARRADRRDAIAFGPFLAAGAIVTGALCAVMPR